MTGYFFFLSQTAKTLNVTNRIKNEGSKSYGGCIVFLLKADWVSLWALQKRLSCYV